MGLFSSCRQEERSLYEGEGLLLLGMEVSEQVDVVSRAASAAEDNQDELKAKCKVRIYEGDKIGLIAKSRSTSTRVSRTT